VCALDLSSMCGLDLSVAGRIAWAGAGLTTGEYTPLAGGVGFAAGFGDTGSVDIDGFTLAGGMGSCTDVAGERA
jgi:hypothetical protein